MSDLSNNIAILSYLKDKVHKWKNISILLGVISILLLLRMMFGDSISSSIETGNYIASVKIEGAIFEDGFRGKVLEKIAKDDSAKAVVVTIDSPGGGIVGSEILFLELRKIAEKKPMVVVMNSLAASGGYMAAIASDYIIAHNGTLTGSIGVLMQSADVVDFAQKIGVKFKTYKSAPLKASPSPFEKTSETVNRVIQASIADSAEFFFDLVKQRRGDRIKKADFDIVFDGRVFTGRQALKVGLVDEVGSKKSAFDYLRNKHKIDSEVISVREIPISKPSDKLFEKFSSILPFVSGSVKQLSGQEIMAVMPY
jgi:protease-4